MAQESLKRKMGLPDAYAVDALRGLGALNLLALA